MTGHGEASCGSISGAPGRAQSSSSSEFFVNPISLADRLDETLKYCNSYLWLTGCLA
jgi:hypothetical protein